MLKRMHLYFVFAVSCACVTGKAQTSTEFAPGVPWPQLGVVVTAEPQALTKPIVIHASEVKYNSHAGGNFLRSQVLAGAKSGVEAKGPHAPVTLHTLTPVLYIRLSSDDPDMQKRRIELLRLQAGKDSRQVVQFTTNSFGGSRKRVEDTIPVTKTDVEGSAWVKVVPDKPLEPGEYAIAFVPSLVVSFPDEIYDFAVAVN